MKYPNYYNQVPSIQLKDELADFLGALENGIVEFHYLDLVKAAGHSCPTVAGAYLSTYKALNALYTDEMPQRGNIKVELKENRGDGVAGVIANVASIITGASDEAGFHGIGVKFSRKNLLFFGADHIQGDLRFTRLDTNEAVDVNYMPAVPPFANMKESMGKILQSKASKEEIAAFKSKWQARVKEILLDHFDDESQLRVKKLTL